VVSSRDRAIGDDTAGLSTVFDPAVIATACRLQVYPKATELSLIRETGFIVVSETLVAPTAGPAKHSFLQRVQLILCRDTLAVLNFFFLNVAPAPLVEATNSRSVVNWEFASTDATTALAVGSNAPILVITRRELHSATNATDLTGAETTRQIHAIDSTSTTAAITTPRGILQDTLL